MSPAGKLDKFSLKRMGLFSERFINFFSILEAITLLIVLGKGGTILLRFLARTIHF